MVRNVSSRFAGDGKNLRPIFVYVFLIVGVRLAGQTTTGQLERIRFGRAAHVGQHSAKRHYRRRQFGDRRFDRRGHAG